MLKKERKTPLKIDVYFKLMVKYYGKLIMARNALYVM